MTTIEQETMDRLEKLGFKTAGDKLRRLAEKKRKLAIAYEHFRFVTQEKIDAFNHKLRKESERKDGGYSQLSFTKVADYQEVPPADVLVKLEEAMDKKCFDTYEVAHIVLVKDPILFGRVTGCPDRFFIADWDSDVNIGDLLMPNEG